MRNPTSFEFEVGEIAIYVRPGSPHFGEEVQILGPPRMWGIGYDALYNCDSEPGMKYEIDFIISPNQKTIVARPEWLKKKPKPRAIDEKVSWDYLNKLMRKEVKV
jgi:hypothetical protein